MPDLDFKGKPFVYAHHLSVPFRELLIDAKKSLPGPSGPSLDDNLIIHGDNLEALKALLPRYAGKVDVIYIDPPYNTGNEGWAYNDNVNAPAIRHWLGKVVDRDDLERHDKWLCMMWPRLQLLKELLSPTGALFASIDDGELHSLVQLLSEIFGDGHVATLPVVNNMKGRNDKKNVARSHEYLVVFDSGEFLSRGLPLSVKQVAAFKHKDDRGFKYALRDLRKRGGNDTREARPRLFFPVFYDPKSSKFSLEQPSNRDAERILPYKSDGTEGCWRWGKEKVGQNLGILHASKPRSGERYGLSYRIYLDPDEAGLQIDDEDDDDLWDEDGEESIERTSKTKSFWWGPELSTDGAKKLLRQMFDSEGEVFEHPKPLALLRRIIHMAADEHSIILDSFAGSGTSGHAVLAANRELGGSRKFILIETERYADSLTAERVRRAIKGVASARHESLQEGTGGSFTFCDLGEPLDLERFFVGETSPVWDQVARYVVYTATGATLPKVPTKAPADWFVGEAGGYRIHLLYKPDLAFMRSGEAAVSAQLAERIAKANTSRKPVLLYAAARYVSQKELSRLGITFCQLPYAIHRLLGDGPTGGSGNAA